jgi:Na+/H+ antiporter NhaD/arsenite permease-like protein
VTVVVLLAPVTLVVANNLRLNPVPFLVAEVLASNIGGTATLIGDPPNILIGSAAGIDFVTFAANMAPVILIIIISFIPLSYLVFRKALVGASPVTTADPVEAMAETNLITDPKLLNKALIVVGAVLIGFVAHGFLHLEPATIALTGAAILLAWSGREAQHALQHVEWTSLLFFVGLFITVEGIVKVGIIEMMAQEALALTQGSLPLTMMLVLWLSAIVSAVVDNIPYTATMIPLVKSLGAGGMPIETLWWALALGADLGGNFTIIGASANVVVASFAARSGHKISFGRFFGYGFLISLVSILIATVYLWLRYL